MTDNIPLPQRIQSIVLEFDHFHHELNIDPDITIITGPSGFGKSLLLEALEAANDESVSRPKNGEYHLNVRFVGEQRPQVQEERSQGLMGMRVLKTVPLDFQSLVSRVNAEYLAKDKDRWSLFYQLVNRRLCLKRIQWASGTFNVYRLDGTPTTLSTGEVQLVSLYFQLVLGVSKGALVLVDEPAQGLHVTTQKYFIRDLKHLQLSFEFQAIIATHAPAVIHGNWHLVRNLTFAGTGATH